VLNIKTADRFSWADELEPSALAAKPEPDRGRSCDHDV
jgi:hypothetical protein